MRSLLSAVVAALVLVTFSATVPADQDQRVETVYSGNTTVVGESLAYPPGEAEVHAVIVTLMPGEETGWHTHGVPLFAYVLEGEVTVTYRGHGARTFRQGDGLLEAMAAVHNGRNIASVPTRILVVFMGAERRTLTSPAE